MSVLSQETASQLAASFIRINDVWCYVKLLVYDNKATTLEKLRVNIAREIAVVNVERYEQVIEN